MLKLAWNNIIRRRGQATLTVAITALTVFVFVLVLGVFVTTSQGLEKSQERLGADAVILPPDAEIGGYELLFTSQPENVYMPANMLDWVRTLDGVVQATPQFYSQTINGDCCSFGAQMRVVGIDQDSDFLLEPYLKYREYDRFADNQIVLGGDFFNYMGVSMSVLDRKFTVAGELYRTGTGMDTTIFMNMDVARDITKNSDAIELPMDVDVDNSISAIMVKLDEQIDPKAFSLSVTTNQEHKARCVLASSTIASLQDQLNAVTKVFLLFWAASLAIAVLALVGRFNALAKDRTKEIGLMRAVGIRKDQVFASIIGEAEIMAWIGGVLGSGAACLLLGTVGSIFQEVFYLPASAWNVGTVALCGLAGMGLAMLLGFLAALYPAVKCSALEPRMAITQGELN